MSTHEPVGNYEPSGRYERELREGRAIARRAGDLALQIRTQGLSIETKSDESPVTIADKECEKQIVAGLTAAFPEDGLLGEEGALKEGVNGRRWIIDPIDGTRDFIRGTRAWSVLIGLEEAGDVVAGFAYFPVTGEMFSASKGGGAFHGTDVDGGASQSGACQGVKQIFISEKSKPAEALICVNGLTFMKKYKFSSELIPWVSQFWTARSMGGCLDAMLVASGRADVWLEAEAKPWDLAPLKIIAEEAGAVTFDFEGNNTIYGGNFVITVPPLAEMVKEFVGKG